MENYNFFLLFQASERLRNSYLVCLLKHFSVQEYKSPPALCYFPESYRTHLKLPSYAVDGLDSSWTKEGILFEHKSLGKPSEKNCIF